MEGVIRWSPHSTATQQRFVLLDADHIKLCEIESFHGKTLRYKQTSQHTKFKGARAFDWSPIDEGLVAVGLPSGEATVLRIDDNSNKSYSFPIKNQRWCNTVSLSNKGLLAAGLDKVRNDFCLNIWDIGQHLSSSDTQAAASGQSHAQIEPVRKLSSSEGVTSVRFFADQPDTLVAGVKGQYLRIYDLRESVGNSSVQFTTRCVNNLAIDPNDENYFASASPQGDTTICIWDRRFGSRSSATNLSSGSNANDAGQSGLVLEFKNVIDRANTAVTAKPLIWNTRFSKRKRGCFGLLSSAGELKVIETLKVYSHPNDGAAASEQPGSAPSGGQELYTNRTRNLEYPFYSQQGGRTEKNRIIAFDFINGGDPIDGHRLVTLTADGDIEVRCLQPPGPNIDFGSKGGLLIGLVENGQTRAREISKRQQGMLKHGQPRLALIEPYNPENKAIAETLQIIREKIEDAEIAIDTDAVTITDPLGTTEPHGNFLSSREAHEKLFSHGPSSFRLDITDALVSASVYRQRSQEGYLLKCDENIDIVADDPWLQELWTFIQYAEEDAEENATIYETMDLSYLGIYAIWNNDLGPHPEARRLPSKRDVDHPSLASAVEGLNRRADRPRFDGTKTEFPEHRQYCLALFGWAFTEKDLKSVVEILVDEGKHSKAAAWAMFHNRPKLAMAGLNKGTESHRLLAMGIAGYQNSARANVGGEDDEWTTLCKDIAQSLQDPYSRAILTLVSDGDWNAVVQQESLPLQDRVGVALRFLDDNKLTAVINDFTAEAIRHGDVEGICLTGLTHQAMDLFQSYIVKFGDIQTAVLAMSFTNPRYVNDFRFEHWREWYRDTIDSWKMHIHRVHFDKQSTRKSITSDGRMLAKMPPPQVTLRCNYCSGSLALDAQKDSASGGEKGAADSLSPGDSVTTATDGNPLGGAGASAGTTCPNCKRHLPRCGVCMKWLGTPNPSTAGGAAAAEEAGKMDNFISMCLVCNHGHHLQHARTWFAEHKMCPVPNCQCTCTKHR